MNKAGSRESRSPWSHIADTVREKLDTVRGRRHSREQSDRYGREQSGRYGSEQSDRCGKELSERYGREQSNRY